MADNEMKFDVLKHLTNHYERKERQVKNQISDTKSYIAMHKSQIRFDERDIENFNSHIEDIKEAMTHFDIPYVNELLRTQISEQLGFIAQRERSIKEREQQIKWHGDSIKAKEEELESFKAINTHKRAEKLESELNLICNSKKLREIVVDSDGIKLKTQNLYITEPLTGKMFWLGRMSFFVSFDKKYGVEIKNIDTQRYGYSEKMNHPHIFADGSPCLGSAQSTVATFRENDELYALYLTLINFCETTDIEEEAGRFIGAWDEVDPDTETLEIIRHGERRNILLKSGRYTYYDGDDRTCACCGEPIYEYDDYNVCDDCDCIVCPECTQYLNNLDKIVCNDCIEANYEVCECCDKLFEAEYMYETTTGWVCDECVEGYHFDNNTGRYVEGEE